MRSPLLGSDVTRRLIQRASWAVRSQLAPLGTLAAHDVYSEVRDPLQRDVTVFMGGPVRREVTWAFFPMERT